MWSDLEHVSDSTENVPESGDAPGVEAAPPAHGGEGLQLSAPQPSPCLPVTPARALALHRIPANSSLVFTARRIELLVLPPAVV